jgi:hypothetical protein
MAPSRWLFAETHARPARFHPGPELKRLRRSNFYGSYLSCGAAFGPNTVRRIDQISKTSQDQGEKTFFLSSPKGGLSFLFLPRNLGKVNRGIRRETGW